jgi:tRNA(Met) C34 N-acetyltransferase TmcA
MWESGRFQQTGVDAMDTLKTGQDVLAILPTDEEWENMNERFHLPVVTEMAEAIDRKEMREFHSALSSCEAAIEVSVLSEQNRVFAVNLISDFGETRASKGDDRLVAQWPSIVMNSWLETVFPHTEVVEKLV